MDVYFTRKFQTVLSGKQEENMHLEDSKHLPRSLGLDRCIRWAEGLCWTCERGSDGQRVRGTCECGCLWDKCVSAVCAASTELEQTASSWGRCLGHPRVHVQVSLEVCVRLHQGPSVLTRQKGRKLLGCL